jgi:hypothetical protein
VYSASNSYAELPLTIQWIAVSILCLILGATNRFLGVVGGAGIIVSFLVAGAHAASAPLLPARSGPAARIYLWILNLLGPPLRSLARERVKWSLETAHNDSGSAIESSLDASERDGATPVDSARVLAATREALVRRGLAVAETDGFQSYDLEIVAPPLVRVPINALREDDGRVSLLWRFQVAPRRALIAAAIALLVLLAAGMPLRTACAVVIIAAIAIAIFAILRARRISKIVKNCANEVASQFPISLAPAAADEA